MSLQLGETFSVLRYRDLSNGSSRPKPLYFSNTMSYLQLLLYPLVCKGLLQPCFDIVNLLSRHNNLHNFIIHIAQNTWVYDLMHVTLQCL